MKTSDPISVCSGGKRFPAVIIMVFTTAIFAYFSSLFYWSADCQFFALQFNLDDSDPYLPIRGLGDINRSMVAHYMTWSGRFLCQWIASFFCALAGRGWFVVCNTLVWLFWLRLCFRLTETRLGDWFRASAITLLSMGVWLTIPLDPSFQVNYLWMGTLNLWWIAAFLRKESGRWYILVAMLLLGLAAGNSQEAYSVPLGGALTLWLLFGRSRWNRAGGALTVSGSRLWGIAGYFIGLAVLIAAPGNFARLKDAQSEQLSLMLQSALPIGLIILVTLSLTIFAKGRQPLSRLLESPLQRLLLFAIGVSAVWILVLKGNSLARTLIPFEVWLLLVVMRNGRRFRLRKTLLLALLPGFCWLAIDSWRMIRTNAVKFSEVERLYHLSEDGRIYLPDDLFFLKSGNTPYYNKGWELRERRRTPGKPDLVIYPAFMKGMELGNSAGGIIGRGKQRWVIVQSLDNPVPIYLKRTLFAGGWRYGLPAKRMDMERPEVGMLPIDTVGRTIIGYYHNEKPFMESEVSYQP